MLPFTERGRTPVGIPPTWITHGEPSMATERTRAGMSGRGNADAFSGSREDKTLALRQLLRTAIDRSGWKHDAVAAAMGLPDGPYLSKILAGKKSLGAHHLAALPEDVEGIFAGLYAETFGHVVVWPTHGDDAVRSFVRGLLGILAPHAPMRMARMAMPNADERA